MLQGGVEGTAHARTLRREMSLPEVLLWNALRTRPAGMKFRRQHPSRPYVADFYCHEARLALEIDGEAHNRGNAPQTDARRDAWFVEHGLTVLRIPATEILHNLDNAVAAIMATTRTS